MLSNRRLLAWMVLVLVIGVLVGVYLAPGLLLFGLGVVAQGHRRGDIDLGDAKVLIEGRQHAGLVGIGRIGEHRGGRSRCMRHLGIDLLLRQAGKTGRTARSQIRCGGVLGKDARRGASTLGAGAIVRGQTGAAAVAEHELSVLGAVARANVCVAIGAERGAVLYVLKAMRADHGILFSEQFKQSRLEHNIATPPQAQGTNSTSPGSLAQ